MKVLMTSHTYYPYNDGVQFVTQYLAEGLAKNGHSVTIITNKKDSTIKEEVYNGVKIIRIDAQTRHTFHKGDKASYISLVEELSKENDVLVNVCTQCATTDWLLNKLDEIKIPKLLYLHSIWDFKYRRENFKSLGAFLSKIFANIRWRLYYNLQRKNLTKYDVVTQLHKMDYTNSFFKKKYNINSLIIENAAEDEFFNEDKSTNIKLPKKYVINVSNYLKRKNQKKCIDIFMKSNIPNDWELILIGSKKNRYYEKIEKYYEKCKNKVIDAKKVTMLHGVPRKEISSYVKNASIYMMTSKWEAFPISLTESMAAKVPFISSDVGIVKYLPGGVVCNSDKEFVYWLEEFSKDENKRMLYGELGFKEASRKYNVTSKVKQFEKILDDLVKKI